MIKTYMYNDYRFIPTLFTISTPFSRFPNPHVKHGTFFLPELETKINQNWILFFLCYFFFFF